MAASSIRPRMLMADASGRIYDHPTLLLLCRRGHEWALPRPDELMPLPDESDLFLLPGRHAVGLDPESGEIEILDDLAVAAFASPGHTLAAHPAYAKDEEAPMLPLFAYGAVGFANNRFYICAKRVDDDPRQVFQNIPPRKIQKAAQALIQTYPDNRLMQHLMNNCVLRYNCPAARNLCLGRYEAPLPVSKACNARCIGCISQQESTSKICATPQNRMTFTPTSAEIVEVMLHHSRQEVEKPVYSFGQGCEGEPLTEADLLLESIATFRAQGGRGTVNLNSNASRPEVIQELAQAGLTSLRVSLNSAREDVYNTYYRPVNYSFDHVRKAMITARKHGVHVALNLLYFPGVTDTEAELAALEELITATGVSLVQLRNLNIDPDYYLSLLEGVEHGPILGLNNFRKRLKKTCPWLRYGYFNPWLGDKATIEAPEAVGE